MSKSRRIWTSATTIASASTVIVTTAVSLGAGCSVTPDSTLESIGMSSGAITSPLDVVTQRNTNGRTGAYAQPGFNSAAVNGGVSWGLLHSLPVDGTVWAQPLYVNGQPTASGTRNLVVVASSMNHVYAFDADTFALAWEKNWAEDPISGIVPDPTPCENTGLGTSAPDPQGQYMSPLELDGNPGRLPMNGVGSPVYGYGVGIQSTPVIDRSAGSDGVLYVSYRGVARNEISQVVNAGMNATGSKSVHQHIAALSLRDGSVLGDVVVDGDVEGNIVALRARASLLLSKGILYVAFGSMCEPDDFRATPNWLYNGQLLAFSQSTLGYLGRFVAAPPADGRYGAGIWQASTGPAADENGDVYLTTGNLVSRGEPATHDGDFANGSGSYGNAILHLHPTIAGSGSTESVSFGAPYGFFTPHREAWMNRYDLDMGAGGTMLIPNTSTVVQGGKVGLLYVLNRDSMCGADPEPAADAYADLHCAQIAHGPGDPAFCYSTDTSNCKYVPIDLDRGRAGVTTIMGGSNTYCTNGDATANDSALPLDQWLAWPHIHGTPVYGQFADGSSRLYVWAEKDYLRAFDQTAVSGGVAQFNPVPSTSTARAPYTAPSGALAPGLMPGGMLSLSIDSSLPEAGVLFASRPQARGAPYGVLHAFDPIPSNQHVTEVWNNLADPPYDYAKFVPPTIANGRVYQATFSNRVLVYGQGSSLLPSAGAPFAVTEQNNGAQLDVLYADVAGSLDVDDAPGAGAWVGPARVAFAPAGAPIATTHLTTNAGDVLYAAFMGDDGTLKVATVTNAATWSMPRTIAQGPLDSSTTDYCIGLPGGPVTANVQGGNQVDVFYVDKWGSLNVQWSTPTGWSSGFGWRFPVPASWPAGQTFLGQDAQLTTGFQGDQLDVFGTATDGTVYVWWLSPQGWAGPYALTSPGFAPSGAALATGVRDGELDVFVATANGVAVLYNAGHYW
jgi:hypothetical protein